MIMLQHKMENVLHGFKIEKEKKYIETKMRLHCCLAGYKTKKHMSHRINVAQENFRSIEFWFIALVFSWNWEDFLDLFYKRLFVSFVKLKISLKIFLPTLISKIYAFWINPFITSLLKAKSTKINRQLLFPESDVYISIYNSRFNSRAAVCYW